MISLYFITCLSAVQPLEALLVSLASTSVVAFLCHPAASGLGAPGLNLLSNTVASELGASCLLLLLLVNLWSCFLAEASMSPAKTGPLRLFLCALGLISLLFFSEISMLKFYVYFELSLVPIFLIVLGWGYQVERVAAAKAMILYTMMGSLPLLVVIISAGSNGETLFSSGGMGSSLSIWSGLAVMAYLAFLVKLPMFFFHMWLPKAHVEAPVVGSMFLAAILLKLGGFGMMKMKLFVDVNIGLSSALSAVALWSTLFVGILCTQASDMKVLIAFSSVAHMAIVVLMTSTQLEIGTGCSILILVSHGLSSSAAFFFSFLIYKTSNSRSMLMNKSLGASWSSGLVFWGLICLGVMGAPPTFNLWVEICSMLTLVLQMSLSVKLLAWAMFFGGAYSFFLLATPLSANSQFLFSDKSSLTKANLTHLSLLGYTLIGLSVLTPLLLF